MLTPGFAAIQQVTADLAVGTSGEPTVIWSITVQSGTSPQITIRNGTAVTDTIVWGPNTAGTNLHYDFPNGLWCPAGAFADVTGTSPVVDITYNQPM